MIDIVIWLIVLVFALFILVKASDYFTESAEKIGLALGMPAFIVGVTIVAIGTSLPELLSSIIAVMKNSTEIVVGNVIGSNIANILLVLGITAIVGKKLKTSYELLSVDLPIMIGSVFFLAITLWDGVFNFWEGLLGLGILAVYIFYTTSLSEKKDTEIKKKIKLERKSKIEWKTILSLFISAIFIFIGAKLTIDSVIQLSEIFNIGKEIIAASAVALGTSLPELMVSVTAAMKGKGSMAIGNVLGSNIFNALAVMGIPAIIAPIIVPQNILIFMLPVLLMVALLYFFITQDKQVTKWEGWMLVIFYVLFLAKLFNLF